MKTKVIFSVFVSLFLMATAYGADENVTQQFQGFNLSGYTDDGKKNWDLRGDTADILGDQIAITNVDANQYGEYTVNIKAKQGVIEKTSGNINLKQDVVITAETGSQLKTDTLQWQKEKDLVSTSDSVVLTDKGMTATGTGLTAKPELRIAQLNKDVTVNLNPEPGKPESQPVTITCDGPLEIDQKQNIAVFQDNVVAISGNRKLKADRIEVYFDPEARRLKKMICLGNVVITQDENTTYSDKAVYDAESEKFILTGRPKLILMTESQGNASELFKK